MADLTRKSGTGAFIDAHMHLYPSKRLSGLIRWMRGFFPDHPVPEDATLEDVLCDLEQHDYKSFVALVFPLKPGESEQLNDFIADMRDTVKGLIPFGCVHRDDPHPDAIVERAILSRRLAGLKFHPMVQRFDPWDRRLVAVYERMNEWKKPIYVHTGFDEWYGYFLPDESLEALLRTYPGIPFVFCHMIFPRLDFAFKLLEHYPNLSLDATNVFGTIAMFKRMRSDVPGLDIESAREGFERHRERIMFGTDHPAGMGTIDQILQDLDDFGLSDETRSEILCGTASRFLKTHCPEHYL